MQYRQPLSTSLVALALLALASQGAIAQTYPVPPAPSSAPGAAPGAVPVPVAPVARVRTGLTLGGGIGVGSIGNDEGRIECPECDSSAAGNLSLHGGWMINPRLSVALDVWVAGQSLDPEGETSLVQVVGTIGAQYWLRPRWWVKAGLGSAHLSEKHKGTGESIDLGEGTAIMAAAGYEAWRHSRFVLEVELRAAAANYEDLEEGYHQGALLVGVSWY